MESFNLKLTIYFANDLKKLKFVRTMNPYVIISVFRNEDRKEYGVYGTKVAKRGASNPVWECPIEYNFKGWVDDDYTLCCEIMHNGKWFNKTIGETRVALKDLVTPENKVCYPVETCHGKLIGELVISHMLTTERLTDYVEDDSSDDDERSCHPRK